eukprot:CAMPEP_0170195638 /NCGR_PEP_ID=MMETSP0040_2-20121228/61889_1 /TAXON_ID=641309 /ORGANISM="Lotharella oceanica, Strain CCMP622" /LENGTH=48 /DNA_ID= /DNA_START= /DNA_END= /DNA_ORIENTATION=
MLAPAGIKLIALSRNAPEGMERLVLVAGVGHRTAAAAAEAHIARTASV